MMQRALSRRLLVWLLPFGILVAATIPAILFDLQDRDVGRSTDAVKYEIPQINEFIQRPFNFIDYPATATTIPGYHILLGWVGKTFGGAPVSSTTLWLRFLHWALSAA